MPNWMDALNTATRPMVPKRAIRGLQETLAPGSSAPLPEGSGILGQLGEVPGALGDLWESGSEYPSEAIRGGMSGVLEGLRGMTSPLDLASVAPVGGALSAVGRVAPKLPRILGPTLDVVEDLPIPQLNPGMGEIRDLLWDLQGNIGKIPSATGKIRRPSQGPVEGLQSLQRRFPEGNSVIPSAEFAPGGEAGLKAYNESWPENFTEVPKTVSDPIELYLQDYARKWRQGR